MLRLRLFRRLLSSLLKSQSRWLVKRSRSFGLCPLWRSSVLSVGIPWLTFGKCKLVAAMSLQHNSSVAQSAATHSENTANHRTFDGQVLNVALELRERGYSESYLATMIKTLLEISRQNHHTNQHQELVSALHKSCLPISSDKVSEELFYEVCVFRIKKRWMNTRANK